MDNEAKALQKSMTETWEKQKGTLCDEFRFQKELEGQALQQRLAETLSQQKTSLYSEFLQERNRMTSDNAQLQSHLEQMRSMMTEVQKEATGLRTQVASQASRIPLPASPITWGDPCFADSTHPALVPPGPRCAAPVLPNTTGSSGTMVAVGDHGGDPPRRRPDNLRGPYDAPETHPQRPAQRPDNGQSP